MNDCPDRDRLERLLNGRLEDTERDELEQHVEGCANCQQTLDELTGGVVCDLEPGRGTLITLTKAKPGLVVDPLGVTAGATTADDERTARVVPTVAGYELKGELGRGGMGVVYEARHVRLNRPCALKMILAGAHAGPGDIARFVTEAEAIARLQHASIVQIRHIGDADGLPFLELEFVAGGSLDQQLDGTPWPPTRAAHLAEQVALGVAEAHREGIVHRDLKPSNVLLAADGTPKVSDFGLAKILDSQSGLTGSESVMGSPSYMAPEQAQGHAKAAGPAADVYAVGAILYELLTGRPPFRGTTALETLEQVKTTEPVSPSRLAPGLPRDIETICLKCLQKDPGKRYATAPALAEDLRRFQDGRPVLAQRTSSVEQAWRWCRRNRLLAGTTIVAVAAILILAVGAITAAFIFREQRNRAVKAEQAARDEAVKTRKAEAEARTEADNAKRSAAESKAVQDFVEHDLLAAARPGGEAGGLSKDVTIRQAVDAVRPRIAGAFKGQPTVEAAIRNTLGTTYYYLGEYELAIRELDLAVELRKNQLGPNDPATLESRSCLALAFQEAGRTADSIELHEDTLKLRTSILGADHPNTLASRNNLATAYLDAGRTSEAITLHEETLTLKASKLGADHPDTLISSSNLAAAYLDSGRTSEAIALNDATLKLRTSKLGADHPDTLSSRNNLARALQVDGRTQEAITMYQENLKLAIAKLGSDHPNTIMTRNNLSVAYSAAGRTSEAIALNDATLKLRTSKLGADHPDTLTSRNNLAEARLEAGPTSESIAALEETLKLRTSKQGADHPDTLTSRNNLAAAYLDAGRTSEAITLHEKTLKLRASKLGADHPDTLASRNNLALAYWTAGRTSESIALNEETLKLSTSKLGADHSDTLTSRNNLAAAYLKAGRTSEAITLHEKTLELRGSELGVDHPDTLISRNNLADAYRKAGRASEAITLQEETFKRLTAKLGPDHPSTLASRNNLALNYGAGGRTQEAITLYQENLKLAIAKLGSDHPNTILSRNNLALAYVKVGRTAEAITMWDANLPMARKAYGPSHPTTIALMNHLATALESLGQWAEALPLRRDVVAIRRQTSPPNSPALTGELAAIGFNLWRQRKWAEAEPVLRDCLKIREAKQPDDWSTLETRSVLGDCLLGQRQFAAAEPLIIGGYEGLKIREAKIPALSKKRLAEAGERIVHLYESWGKTARAAQWRQKLGLLPELPDDPFRQ